jgi:MFS family permease
MESATRRVVAARFVSRTGGEAAFFVGIWGKAAFEFGADPGALAWLMAALGLAGLAGASLAGVLIDRHGPRRVLVVSELVFVPVALSGALAGNLLQLTLVAVGIGLVGTPTFTAIASFPPYLTADERMLSRINGWVETAGMAALITGTAAGALLVRWISLDAIFVFDAATSVVGALLVTRVATRDMPRGDEERRGGLHELREGLRTVYRRRRLRFYVLAGTSVWLLFGLFSALEPLFYRDVLRTGPEALGWVNTIFGVGLVAGTLAATRLPEGMRGARAVVFLVVANGAGSVLYTGTALLPVVVIGAVVWGVVIGLFAPMVRTMIHVNTPEGMFGRVMGTTQVHSETAKILPLLVAPILATGIGVQPSLAGSGLVVGCAALFALAPARTLDRTREAPVPSLETGTVADEPLSPTP